MLADGFFVPEEDNSDERQVVVESKDKASVA